MKRMPGETAMQRERGSAATHGDSGFHPRTRKRERYTRVACETCKVRKVKCSGDLPCSRCLELDTECKYQDVIPKALSEYEHQEKRRRKLSGVAQQDIDRIFTSLRRICDEFESTTSHKTSPPSNSLKPSQSANPPFRDTNTAHETNDLWELTLARGILEERGLISSTSSAVPSYLTNDAYRYTEPIAAILQAAQPILSLGYDAVISHMMTFHQEICWAYPCIDLIYGRRRLDALFAAATSVSFGFETQEIDVKLADIEITKVLIAISTLARGEDDSPFGSNLEAVLSWNINNVVNNYEVEIEDIIISCMLAIYFILRDERSKAWRISSFAARACLELGMHRNIFLGSRVIEPESIPFLRKLFLCAFDLDRRCSFTTSLPWTIHDKDVEESNLGSDNQYPFLSAMVSLDRIHTEVVELMRSSLNMNSKEAEDREAFLDYRVQKLVTDISSSFVSDSVIYPGSMRQRNAQVFFQIRASHVRMLTKARFLQPEALVNRPQSAQLLVSLAMSTIELHVKTLRSRGICRLIRQIMDTWLMKSVSCLFLAASGNPDEYGLLCRSAFHAGIDCLKQSSYRPDPRLWCSLADLQKLANDIQMPPLGESPPTASRTDGYSGYSAASESAFTTFNLDDDLLTELINTFPGNSDPSVTDGSGDYGTASYFT